MRWPLETDAEATKNKQHPAVRDQHDAYSIAAWMQQTDKDGRLAGFLNPELTPEERSLARLEGWILGVA